MSLSLGVNTRNLNEKATIYIVKYHSCEIVAEAENAINTER